MGSELVLVAIESDFDEDECPRYTSRKWISISCD